MSRTAEWLTLTKSKIDKPQGNSGLFIAFIAQGGVQKPWLPS
jgi:hypothetical protein